MDKVTGSGALHIVADTDLNRTSRAQTGSAYLEIGQVSSTARLYLSTNVYATVGTVSAGATFDYACESNATTIATLDITNSCSTAAKVRATDIALLPARLSGFTGSVTIDNVIGQAVRDSFTIPMDFSKGTNALYQTVGCNGSGTLVAAPETGTINATFATSGAVMGDYALVRFTSGGERLAGWNILLNGQAVDHMSVGNGLVARVRKDETGLWLRVNQGGMTILFR